ncbi:hypothetical protein OIO90_006290 [Microbotryomycetes sp. JL221]|nr:hypothetical protein OIO90_006290 [Microbotryomycetes sp. JL221]
MSSTAGAPPPSWHDWRLNPPTSTPESSTMLVNQPQIPKLPVPKLEDTLKRLSDSIEPLAESDEELNRTKQKLQDFVKQGGIGHELQKRLEARRDDPNIRNWIAEWWDQLAYMAYRDSVVVNVSYYYGFKRLPQAPSNASDAPAADPAYVAASIVYTALEFRNLISKGLLEPEKVSKEGGELCMESYKWAFNACRVPATGADYAVKVAEEDPAGQHFVVIRNNNFYTVPLNDQSGRRFTVAEFQRAFQAIIDRNDKQAPGVGVLTGINRDRWTKAHAHLLGSNQNANTIKAIQNSAFIVCLDEATPNPKLEPIQGSNTNLNGQGICDFSERIWKASGKSVKNPEIGNRWWDKPLQWVVFKNGEAGFIGEHSCMDGTPTARLNDYLTKRLLTNKPELVGAQDPPAKETPSVKPIPFEVDNITSSNIQKAEKEFVDHVNQYQVNYLHYGRYGKEGIKKMKTSPDGWTQMVFQLAYFMTFGKPCGTYEAAQVRRYQLGRTETVRICTKATVAFTKSMLDSNHTNADRKKLFQEAIQGHGQDMKMASAAMGIDRHLFGLKRLLKEGEEAPLLSDELVAKSSTWKMSTSQIFIENSPAYGWGPVVYPDGLGIPYMIHTNHLQFTVTSHESVPGQQFIDNLGKAADMIMDMMEQQ